MTTKQASLRSTRAGAKFDSISRARLMGTRDGFTLSEIVRDAKVAIFLHDRPELLPALTSAGVRQVAWFSRNQGPCDAVISSAIIKPYKSLLQVRENNAEVLILDGAARLAAYQLQNLAHAEFILTPAGAIGWLLRAVIPPVSHREIRYRGKLEIAGVSWLAFKGTRRRRGIRCYISAESGIRAFAQKVGDLRYSILRWHDRLGDLDKMSDLDVLIHNDDLPEFRRRLDEDFGFFPVDVKTAHLEPGKNKGRIYFPAARAFELLSRSVVGRFGERRPTPRDSLAGFAYHLLLQKPIGQLGPDDEITPATWPHRRHSEELARLCDEAGVERFTRLSHLETFLKSEGWFPPWDMLSKMSRRNPFIRQRYYGNRDYKPGLAVFALREVAVRHGIVGATVDMLRQIGFIILAEGPVPEDLRAAITLHWRGGNWATLSSGEPSGGPAYYVIAEDPQPKSLSPLAMWWKERHRNIDNRRMLLKDDIRRKAVALIDGGQFNALHSSDNSREALEYIRVIRPDLHDELSARFRYASHAS